MLTVKQLNIYMLTVKQLNISMLTVKQLNISMLTVKQLNISMLTVKQLNISTLSENVIVLDKNPLYEVKKQHEVMLFLVKYGSQVIIVHHSLCSVR